jgi:hypothetical protein
MEEVSHIAPRTGAAPADQETATDPTVDRTVAG